jgi:GntR family negative regulator for fad regulon and positive regulator of fabA
MPSWSPPLRPAAYAEQALITAFLKHDFPPGSTLPAERELAAQLGVTRPTLRETLQRLERDGWLTIQHGKPTRVNNFWLDGGLNVLSALVRYEQELPSDFIPNLLDVRLSMAPAYARAAVEHAPQQVVDCLSQADHLADTPAAYASFDWQLHHTLTIASGNPVYTLILNGFSGFYEQMAAYYFAAPEARRASCAYYAALLESARQNDPAAAEQITRQVMQESIALWKTRR